MIGAGVSGLVTIKRLADYGIPFDCFETGDTVGGNWAFRNANGRSSAYRSLHIDTSKERLRFKDYAIPSGCPDFPHHSQIKDYLDAFCDAFELRRRITFETTVERCERLPGGGWKVHTDDGATRRYDVVVVANGHHWDPRYPEFPGAFDGPAIHSHQYVDPAEPLELRGKRLLVVGIGNSAADIVSEVAQRSNSATVFLSTRSGAYVVPKYFVGRPLDRIVQTNPRLPLRLQRRLLQLVYPVITGGRMERYGLPRPNHRFLEAHPTISSELLLRLASGDAVVKPDVERLESDRVRFVDGSVEPIDAIIYATGYKISFPFFDPGVISAPENRIGLYKRVFKPGLDDVVFVGFAQALPTLFPFAECQAGLVARYLAGRYRPPQPSEMEAVIAADERRFTDYFKDSPRHTQQLDYFVYEHELRTREIPQGRRRVEALGAVGLAGRATAAELEAAAWHPRDVS